MLIVIASGKGGTGKTFVSTNLAFSLAEKQPVQLIDCDVEEPNAHLFLPMEQSQTYQINTLVPLIDNTKCNGCGLCTSRCMYNALSLIKGKVILFSDLCHSCGGCILYCTEQALSQGAREIGHIEIGRSYGFEIVKGVLKIRSVQAPELIQETLHKADITKTVIVDAPPGTSCSAVAAVTRADFCVMVTEPTPYGLHDLKLAVKMAEKLDVPTGVIINKFEKNNSKTEQYCINNRIPILLKIPFKKEIATAYAEGKLICQEFENYKDRFRSVLRSIERVINNA